MAAGKAVIATSVGGVPDVIQHGQTGLLVPPKDPTALANSMLELIKDANLRNRLGERAQTSAVSKYDKTRLLRDMEDFYLGLVPEMD
jgi:glycosyltransferase involved in cell wall biosynthesis